MKAITVLRSASKALVTMPKKDALAITSKLRAYAGGEKQDVVRLSGSAFLRLRHGDWRAVFEETETEIIVHAVAHRREVYR
jgi:mRNA interferase RelE/StbE